MCISKMKDYFSKMTESHLLSEYKQNIQLVFLTTIQCLQFQCKDGLVVEVHTYDSIIPKAGAVGSQVESQSDYTERTNLKNLK